MRRLFLGSSLIRRNENVVTFPFKNGTVPLFTVWFNEMPKLFYPYSEGGIVTIKKDEGVRNMIHIPSPSSLFFWYLGRELNSYRDNLRGILSPLRLPVPPPRQRKSKFTNSYYIIFLNFARLNLQFSGDIFNFQVIFLKG